MIVVKPLCRVRRMLFRSITFHHLSASLSCARHFCVSQFSRQCATLARYTNYNRYSEKVLCCRRRQCWRRQTKKLFHWNKRAEVDEHTHNANEWVKIGERKKTMIKWKPKMDALTFERENEKMDDKEKRRIPQSSAVAQSYFAVMSFETNEFATNNFAAYAFSFVILRENSQPCVVSILFLCNMSERFVPFDRI